MTEEQESRAALIAGASRGLGEAIAAALVDRGWHVVGTVRDRGARTPLHALADASRGAVEVEELDLVDAGSAAALRDRLGDRRLDLLFVVGGTTSDEETPIGDVSTEAFVDVFTTNALGPMRVIERLHDLVPDDGLVAAMTSGQGSIGNNTTGSREVYRGSKAALNMFLRSFSVRESQRDRAFLLVAPGWVRTALGGPEAPYTIEDTVPRVVDLLLSHLGRPGLEYVDRNGDVVPW